MDASEKSAALIELGPGHHECLYPQALFLKRAGYRVYLIVNQSIHEHVAGDWVWDGVYPVVLNSSGNWYVLFQVARYLRQKRVGLVVVNTAQIRAVKNLLYLTGSIPCAGILHNVQRLVSSYTQKRISRKIKRYFVLNDYLLRDVRIPPGVEVRSFYPIFFPEYPEGAARPKKAGELRIVIPGQLEFQRRNYRGLIEALSSEAGRKLDAGLHFVLLGNSAAGDGPEIKALIYERGLETRFTFFEGYLPEADYHDWFRSADLALPLVHPEIGDGFDYLKENITGAFNFAFAYRKPLLISAIFSGIDDFEAGGIFYSDLLTGLQQVSQDGKLLQAASGRIASYKKFSFEYQYKSYIDFVEKTEM